MGGYLFNGWMRCTFLGVGHILYIIIILHVGYVSNGGHCF